MAYLENLCFNLVQIRKQERFVVIYLISLVHQSVVPTYMELSANDKEWES